MQRNFQTTAEWVQAFPPQFDLLDLTRNATTLRYDTYAQNLSHDHLQDGIICHLDFLKKFNEPLEELVAIQETIVVHLLGQLHAVIPLAIGRFNVNNAGRACCQKPAVGLVMF